MAVRIEFTRDSFLKQKPLPSDQLPGGNKISQGAGSRYDVELGPQQDKHQQVQIPIEPGGKRTWWVFSEHFRRV